jgi:hypothetical protein
VVEALVGVDESTQGEKDSGKECKSEGGCVSVQRELGQVIWERFGDGRFTRR